MMAEARTASDPTDPLEKLIREGEHRDAAALATREHGAALGRLCMALLGNQAEAEEAAQETLIAAFKGMSSFRGEGSFKSWLFGIGRKVCAKRLAKRVRQDQKLRLVHDAEAEAKLPDELVETRRKAVRVREALEELRPSEREAVVLRYGTGLAYRKVGEACGIEEATARKRVSRALSKLRTLLAEEGA